MMASRTIAESWATRLGRSTPASTLLLVVAALVAACSSTGPKTTTPTVASVVVSPGHDTLAVGAGVQLTAVAYDASNAVVSGQTFTWSSDMPGVASVSGTGMVSAITAGGPVHIKAMDGSVSGTSTIVDTAPPGPPATVKVAPAVVSLQVGGTQQLTDTVKDASGNVITGLAITWSTANAAIATVSSTGLVTGVGAGGPISVTATATASGKMGSSQVTVTPASGSVSYAGITAGLNFACAWTSAGVAYCWGAGGQGQLGDASFQANHNQPIMVTGGQSWRAVRAGGAQTCAVTTAGAPYCWGTGPRIGDNTTTASDVPVAVYGGLIVDSLSAGPSASCALKASGALYCWGDNEFGEMGTNNTSLAMDSTPQPVDQGALVFKAASSGGDEYVCALTSGGAAYCWGSNTYDQLGTTAVTGDSVPIAVTGGLLFTSIATGGDHSCGIVTTGPTRCWGDDGSGELGDGNFGTSSATPVLVTGGHTFIQVVAGGSFSCGLTAAGVAWCWGNNTSGQAGQGTTSGYVLTPVAVMGGLTFTTISAGADFVCGLVASGAAYCWGDDAQGQLGNGVEQTSFNTPQLVAQPL